MSGSPRSASTGRPSSAASPTSARPAPPPASSNGTALQRITVGEFTGAATDRVQRIVATLRDAGVEATVTDTIDVELWRKLAFIAPLAAVCGLARRPVGAVRAGPPRRAVFERAVREVVAVGRASGVALADAIVHDAVRAFDALQPDVKPSLLLDLERGGPK